MVLSGTGLIRTLHSGSALNNLVDNKVVDCGMVGLLGVLHRVRPITDRWVDGEDCFGRERELGILDGRVRDGNHVLLTGQRRVGKTSVARELGRRLEVRGWLSLFVDVESANSEEDVITEFAWSMHHVRALRDQVFVTVRSWLKDRTDGIGAPDSRAKFRAGLNSRNWRHHGEDLLSNCAESGQPVLLVIDELPIFLQHLSKGDGGRDRADLFLSWLRGGVQTLGSDSPVLLISGSIGLQPLVERLGMPARINYLHPFRLGPWDRATTVRCFESLARSQNLSVEDGVAGAVYEALKIGVPHHVQSFFARLRDFAAMRGRSNLTLADVDQVYRFELLGASGQHDLVHYAARLSEALEGPEHSIAMEILAETATQGALTRESRQSLAELYSALVDKIEARIVNVVALLEHDGYIESDQGSYRMPSRLLKDWWSAQFRGHYKPLAQRCRGFPVEHQSRTMWSIQRFTN